MELNGDLRSKGSSISRDKTVSRNITERKTMEERIRTYEKSLHLLTRCTSSTPSRLTLRSIGR